MNRRDLLAAVPLCGLGCRAIDGSGVPELPELPEALIALVPSESRQVVLVLSPRAESVAATMWCLGRATASEAWALVGSPERVVVGRHGLAWGSGELTPASPPGPAGNGHRWRLKREGDGCAPAGVFRLPFAFGRATPLEASWVRLPYQQTSSTLRGVDDPASRYYNQVVDEARLPEGGTKDWTSSEEMLRADGVYDWGVFVGHNHPKPVGGPEARGSCIFLHRWSGPRAGTAGCTAMSPATLHDLLRWLDPAAEPVLVQTVDGS